MTLIAGAFSIAAGVVLPPPLKAALRQHLRRAPDERGSLSSHDSQALFLVKWDSGSFKEPAWREGADGSLATLVGDPLLADGGTRLSRAEQLAHLTGPDSALNDGELARTRGAFSIAAFSATTHTLTLATDMIGLRPLYYTVQDGVWSLPRPCASWSRCRASSENPPRRAWWSPACSDFRWQSGPPTRT